MGYMEGRKHNDLPGAYQSLSKETKALYSKADFVQYYGQFTAMEWQRVGPVHLMGKEWARVVVYDLAIIRSDGTKVQLPDVAYYVHKADSQWGLALINPVLGRLDAVQTSQEAMETAQALMKVHPYNSNVHTQLYFAYMAAGDAARAQGELRVLYKIAAPSELASLQALKANFLLQNKQAAHAVKALGMALKLGQAYPETYSDAWRSTTLTTQAKAQLNLSQTEAARQALTQALEANPRNAEARSLLDGMAKPRT